MFLNIILSGSLIDLDFTFFVQLFIFLLLIPLLNYTIFKPMISLFKERDESTIGLMNDAKIIEKDVQLRIKQYKQELEKLKIEAGKERDIIRLKAKEKENEIIESAKQKVYSQINEEREKLRQESARIKKEIEEMGPKLGEFFAEIVSGKNIK